MQYLFLWMLTTYLSVFGGIPFGFSLTTLRGTLQLVATRGVSKLPSSKPSSPASWLCSLCVRPGSLQAGFAGSPFCHRISCPQLTGKSLQLGAVVMGPAVLPVSKLLFLTSPCLGGKPVATLAGLWSRACWAPAHLAKSRAVLGSKCSALFPAPFPDSCPSLCPPPLVDPLHSRKAGWPGYGGSSNPGIHSLSLGLLPCFAGLTAGSRCLEI